MVVDGVEILAARWSPLSDLLADLHPDERERIFRAIDRAGDVQPRARGPGATRGESAEGQPRAGRPPLSPLPPSLSPYTPCPLFLSPLLWELPQLAPAHALDEALCPRRERYVARPLTIVSKIPPRACTHGPRRDP